uniref:Double-stranded RNA-binding protein Staufen homolog 2 n=1 Tax=Lepisosteus oculatus TaxID=7918 RepID=W5M7R9_LEPOC
MAQVKVQTAAGLPGPGMSPIVPPAAVPSPGPVSLQPSVNGAVPAPVPSCPSPATGLLDSAAPASPPASSQENMANPKEKTPMCLVNELARFNRIQPQYKLLSERGPAHAKIFTVQLALGEQTWEAEGTSIKKAQHSTASKALTESPLPRPSPRPPKMDANSNPGSITPTVELNGLAMKRGEPAIYRPLDPKPIPNYRANYNFRGMFNQRYHYPVPKIFYVQLMVGNSEFIGEGRTRQAARHNAAMKALQVLRNEPIPEKPPQSPEEKDEAEQTSDASKSEISLVYEIALKRNLLVSFEVSTIFGSIYLVSSLTRVTDGDASSSASRIQEKLYFKRNQIQLFALLISLPIQDSVEKEQQRVHYITYNFFTEQGASESNGMMPLGGYRHVVSASTEKEDSVMLRSSVGHLRRKEDVLKAVKVGSEIATGTGPNKKVSKRNAAEAMLLQLGYKASTPAQSQPEKTMENKSWNGQKTAFPEATSNTQKGILHLSPDVYQEMEASRNKVGPGAVANYLTPKDMGQGSSSFFTGSTSNTVAIARELLLNGASPTAEAIGLKGKAPASPCASVQPSQQLEYLARIQGFQVQYNDGPNGKECMTYLTLSPVQMTFHGSGSSIEASHDQ